MFRRSFSFLKVFYFVDTNVIIDYQNDISNVRNFVEDPDNAFYFTETVKEELERRSRPIPKKFNFCRSALTFERKENGIKLLDELWHKQFDSDPHCISKGFGLNKKQLSKFKNDLFIIFEACSSCHKPNVLPDNMLETPPLITNNMDLLRKFLLRNQAEDVLETVVNLAGFEHLMPVLNFSDVIDEWLEKKEIK
jgi:hypothetical protein